MVNQSSRLIGRSKSSVGLAPVVCYDPWFPRSLESIKKTIADGFPILVRLHSGSSYARSAPECYEHDMESQAVMIIGYDDAKQAVQICDPWDRRFGGQRGGSQWIPYEQLIIEIVDSSRGWSMPLSTLDVTVDCLWSPTHALTLEIAAGFYTPTGRIMDREGWAINDIHVSVQLGESWGASLIEHHMQGPWHVGGKAVCSIALPGSLPSEGELAIELVAGIQGARPYAFQDHIKQKEELRFAAAEQACFTNCLAQ